MHVRNEEDVPLFYVIRDDDLKPTGFTDLMEELVWTLPHNTDLATYRRDNNKLFQILMDVLSGNANLMSFARADGAEQAHDGRKSYFSVRSCCVGIDAREDKRALYDSKLSHAKWTGWGQGQASTQLIAHLLDCYSQLEILGKEYTDVEKIRKFYQTRSPAHDLNGTTYYKAVSDKAKDFIRRISNGEDADIEGRPLTFAAFAQFVNDEEREWLKWARSKKSISQVTTESGSNTASTSSSSSSSNSTPKPNTYDKETGEPLHRYIFSMDVGLLYKNVERLDEDEFKTIPNVMKEYFRKHSKKDMPKRFKNMKKPEKSTSRNNWKNKKKKANDGDAD